jgi:hypothetical protein
MTKKGSDERIHSNISVKQKPLKHVTKINQGIRLRLDAHLSTTYY